MELFIAVPLAKVFVSNGSLVYSSKYKRPRTPPLSLLPSPGRPSRSAWLCCTLIALRPCVCVNFTDPSRRTVAGKLKFQKISGENFRYCKMKKEILVSVLYAMSGK